MTISIQDEKTQRVLAEVQARIKAVYPEATFTVVVGEDPVGIYLDAYTDATDGFAVLDLVSDWLVRSQRQRRVGHSRDPASQARVLRREPGTSVCHLRG